jgi:hypothetical protein
VRINVTRVTVIVIIEVTAYGEAYAHLSLSVLAPKLSLWKSVPRLKLRIRLLKKFVHFMEPKVSLPYSEELTTRPGPCQMNPVHILKTYFIH